jgi:hypothetical protein
LPSDSYNPYDDIEPGQLYDPSSDLPLERIEWQDISEYVYDHASEMYGTELDDEYLESLLETGWLDEYASYEDRFAAREELFDYLDWDEGDFPWELWKEFYDS